MKSPQDTGRKPLSIKLTTLAAMLLAFATGAYSYKATETHFKAPLRMETALDNPRVAQAQFWANIDAQDGNSHE